MASQISSRSSSSHSASLPPTSSSQDSLPPITSVATDSLASLQKQLKKTSETDLKKWADSQDEGGKTPLAHAIEAHSLDPNKPKSSKVDIIEYLITICKADPNLADNDKWTPLYRAATGAKTDALHYLLSSGAEPNAANKDGSTPIHRAVDRRAQEDVKTLIKFNADVNAVNSFGTPLAYAAKNGDIAVASILIENQADPNLVIDPLDQTPLQLAKNNRKDEMAAFLALHGGVEKIDASSKAHTELSRLVLEGDPEKIQASYERGDIDSHGRTVVHYLAAEGRVDLLSKMNDLQKIDLKDSKGRTPLHYAVINGHLQTINALLENQCQLDSKDKQGYFPLFWACQFNQVDIARQLLQRSVGQLSMKDNFGWSLLHKAAQVGNLELVKMFVEEYQVDASQLTSNGRTPLDLANITEATEVVDYLSRLNPPMPLDAVKA